MTCFCSSSNANALRCYIVVIYIVFLFSVCCVCRVGGVVIFWGLFFVGCCFLWCDGFWWFFGLGCFWFGDGFNFLGGWFLFRFCWFLCFWMLWGVVFILGRWLVWWFGFCGVFGLLSSFARLYRFNFASFYIFCWLVCCSARNANGSYFLFFEGSWMDVAFELL